MVKLDVMYKALLAKFSQNLGLKELLKGTGERKLIEHSFYDSFWGDGGDNTGQNYLGKLLMQLRGELRGGKVGIPSVVYARNGSSPGTKPRQIVEQDASNSSSFGTGGGRGDTSTPPSLGDSGGGGRGDTSTPPSLGDSRGGGRGDTSTPPSLGDSGGGGRGDTSTPPSLGDSGGGGQGDGPTAFVNADASPSNSTQQQPPNNSQTLQEQPGNGSQPGHFEVNPVYQQMPGTMPTSLSDQPRSLGQSQQPSSDHKDPSECQDEENMDWVGASMVCKYLYSGVSAANHAHELLYVTVMTVSCLLIVYRKTNKSRHRKIGSW